MNKKEIISIIQNTDTFTNPKIELEQYCIDATSAVDLIYLAGFEFDDIKNHLIFDLGAGTGRLSIVCAYFKAKYVISVDIDWTALKILKNNIQQLELEKYILPICSDIKNFEISKSKLPHNLNITTIMNPPFGVQRRTADRIFLEKAFFLSEVVYSIHLANKKIRQFISKYVTEFNWKIDNIIPYNMVLQRSFPFHSQKTKKIDVDIFRFIKNR